MKKLLEKSSKFLLWLTLLAPIVSFAQARPEDDPNARTGGPAVDFTVPNPLKGDIDTLQGFITLVLNDIVLPIGAVLATIFIIYAGFKYVKAHGNPEKIKEAHQTFLWTVIGVAILLGAVVISAAIEGTIDQFRASP